MLEVTNYADMGFSWVSIIFLTVGLKCEMLLAWGVMGGLRRGMFSVSSSSSSHIVCFSSISDKYNLFPIDIHCPRAGYPNANGVTFSEYCIHRIILSTWVSSVSLASPARLTLATTGRFKVRVFLGPLRCWFCAERLVFCFVVSLLVKDLRAISD